MIGRLRDLLAGTDLRRRLAAVPGTLPASTVVSLAIDLGPGNADWLTLIPDQGDYWYWAQPDRGDYRLGLGQALGLASAGRQRFAALDHGFAGIAGHWHSAPGAQAFLGFAFDEEGDGDLPNAQLAVPTLLLRSHNGRASAVLSATASGVPQLPERLAAVLGPRRPPASLPALHWPRQPLAERAWQARVQAALRAIAAGQVDKVVLARAVTLPTPRPLAIAPLLAGLLQRQPDGTVYARGQGSRVFLGATPERLVTLHGGRAEADALAGTAWPGSAALDDEKNGREQDFVRHAVRHALAPLCVDLATDPAPEVVTAGPLTHLRSRIGGPVRPGIGLFDLIAALHPTPAVGGHPWPAARDWLRRHHEARGAWYSGGLGWIDPAGDGEVVVPLRCATRTADRVELQAGAGIVAGSDPARELAETEAKLATLRQLLAPAATGAEARQETGTR